MEVYRKNQIAKIIYMFASLAYLLCAPNSKESE